MITETEIPAVLGNELPEIESELKRIMIIYQKYFIVFSITPGDMRRQIK